MVRNVVRWPEMVVSTAGTRRAIHDAERRGELRKIASRVYTSNHRDAPTDIIRRHWLRAVAGFFPGSVISDRSAASSSLRVEGFVFLVHDGPDRDLRLPGLEIRARHGRGPLEADPRLGADIHLASPARTVVENLVPSRRRGALRRRLSPAEVEEYLDQRLRIHGEADLRSVLDEIPGVAAQLGLEREGERAQGLIREFLGTHGVEPRSDVLRKRLQGRPYDPARLELFRLLRDQLLADGDRPLPADATLQPEFAFFEAYFSNYIEGTEFELEEARRIIEMGEIPVSRPRDAHDVIGTYELVSDADVMSVVPNSPSELVELLRDRHRRLMAFRPEVRPGMFKIQDNRAGATTFVSWELVEGTLREGFDVGSPLTDPFARAVYIAFLVAEIHPFDDGNGRIARVMLNAQLFSHGQQRILVPTNRREDYLDSLRVLSRHRRSELLPRVMADLQTYSGRIDWGTFDLARDQLEADHALEPPARGPGGLAAMLERAAGDRPSA